MQSNTVLRDSDPLANGESFIPASQRPDGTWRKPRRVKEGYVPQEEVPLYESKGKKFMNRQVTPRESKIPGFTAHKSIPGYYIEDKPVKTPKTKKSKVKAKKVDVVTSLITELKITEQPKKKVSSPAVTVSISESSDPMKKVKNLKKRLREVESLEEKINSGAIAKPEKEQLDKLKRKNDLIMQIYQLEKEIQ